jgi:hypothetical protein
MGVHLVTIEVRIIGLAVGIVQPHHLGTEMQLFIIAVLVWKLVPILHRKCIIVQIIRRMFVLTREFFFFLHKNRLQQGVDFNDKMLDSDPQNFALDKCLLPLNQT